MDASSQSPLILPAPSCDVSGWFDREVRSHEAALRAYLRGRFPALSDADDIVQEASIRVLRAHEAGQVRSPKGLLFTIAKNLALDVFRRQTATPHDLANLDDLPVIQEEFSATLTHEAKLQLLEQALLSLPERCRQVIMLKRFQGLSYQEISERLGISRNTISAHMTAGVKKCRNYLQARGVTKAQP
ncbi:MAG: polymerase, sigma-24 subunit, subfamily [Verrucomicrobia bacterium]|nr:polymerase, sigma-24 subunit, subfamily [Verrucomicrobiota bacterium]